MGWSLPMGLRLFFQRPPTGSKWYRGNFTFGLEIDSHPRFVNVILCLLIVEIGIGWTKKTSTRQMEES